MIFSFQSLVLCVSGCGSGRCTENPCYRKWWGVYL